MDFQWSTVFNNIVSDGLFSNIVSEGLQSNFEFLLNLSYLDLEIVE